MKQQNLSTAGSMILVMALATAWHVEAGYLNPPPGAVAPTNCTQINEQSVSLPVTITTPRCYILTSNLTGSGGQNGIVIQEDNVTLDLNGFAVIGEAGAPTNGIQATGLRKNIEIAMARSPPAMGLAWTSSVQRKAI